VKIVSIVGARPQFIKASPVSKALRQAKHQEFIIHTGQHYDYEMSRVFFDEMKLPTPDVNLEVGSGSHGFQTGNMLITIEEVLLSERPDWVLVYGDTNSTLAGALAACKLRMPLAHVEAGLRSFNREMPEEHNRVLTDHCSEMLFCPTRTAVENLAKEGVEKGVHLVGDTMYDALLEFVGDAVQRSSILKTLQVKSKGYLLATLHRPYNVDNPEKLRKIIESLVEIDEPVVFPVHPRTEKKIGGLDGNLNKALGRSRVRIINPVSYFDMLMLEKNAMLILTDSGGMQKEAYFLGVPCITLRPETEWRETVDSGWNVVAGCNKSLIVSTARSNQWPKEKGEAFGDGHASKRIVSILENEYREGKPR
jgi:UDP-N-acetylglucosamine 2-epimerase